jgi:hypothetical protein
MKEGRKRGDEEEVEKKRRMRNRIHGIRRK